MNIDSIDELVRHEYLCKCKLLIVEEKIRMECTIYGQRHLLLNYITITEILKIKRKANFKRTANFIDKVKLHEHCSSSYSYTTVLKHLKSATLGKAENFSAFLAYNVTIP